MNHNNEIKKMEDREGSSKEEFGCCAMCGATRDYKDVEGQTYIDFATVPNSETRFETEYYRTGRDNVRKELVATPTMRGTFFNLEGYMGSDEEVIKYWYKGELEPPLEEPELTYAEHVEANRPTVPHYQQGNIEPIDFITSHDMNFNLGNAVKYITRCNHKGSKLIDIQKAIDYLNFELERQEANLL